MRCSTATGLMLAAITIGEVVAGPTHAHLHKHMRDKKDVDWAALDWDAMGIDWSSAWAAGQKTAAPAAVATTAAPAPPATTPANSPAVEIQQANSEPTSTSSPAPAASPVSSGSGSIWHNLVGKANSNTAFGAKTATSGVEVSYISNIGVPECSNMMFVSSTSGYDFTNEFINTSNEGMTIVVWNKAATQGLAGVLSAALANLGASIAPVTPALAFYLEPGASKLVAFEDATVIGWAEATDEIAESGAFAATWGEVQYNAIGSGYDVSAIMNPHNNNYIMEITSVEAPACRSSNTENFWLTATDPVGDSNGSCFIAQSVAHLTTKMGGTA